MKHKEVAMVASIFANKHIENPSEVFLKDLRSLIKEVYASGIREGHETERAYMINYLDEMN